MKPILRRFTLLIGLLLLTVPATAENLNDVLDALELPFRVGTPDASAIHDIETEFTQQSTIASLDQVQEGAGRVMLKFDYDRVDRVPRVSFRWEYDVPTRQEIVSNGRTFWVYVPDNNQVIQSEIDQVSEARPENPLTFLTGLGNLSRDFVVRWGAPNIDDAGNYVLQLTPKRTTSTILSLTVTVDRVAVQDYVRSGRTGDRFPIVSTLAVDPNENTTRIVFDQQRMRVNRGMSDAFFDYIPPAGVDVVRPNDRFGY